METDEQVIQLRADEQDREAPLIGLEQPESADEVVDALDASSAADVGPLHELLFQAGARIDPLLLPEWTPDQIDDASEWARAQIAATAADEPGRHTSVKWPDHVSAAHHESAAGGVDASIGAAEVLSAEDASRDTVDAADAISKAAEQLDAEKAGHAARPMYQPPLPGTHPPFDWRTAQLRTEHLEAQAAGAESAWDEAKEEASARKKDYDAAIEALRKYIQATHIARVEAEYHHGTDSGPIAPAPVRDERPVAQSACLTERTTGKPCPICRNLTVAPADNDSQPHLAASVLALALEATLEPPSLAAALREILRVIVPLDTIALWTSEDVQILARYLQQTVGDSDEARASKPVPLVLGRAHEIGGEMGRGCRICGALMHQLAVDEGFPEGFPIGQRVGTDCAGAAENAAAEPVRTVKPRHSKKSDRRKAKQASAAKDHAAAQKAEGKQRTAKATLKSGAKKNGSKS